MILLDFGGFTFNPESVNLVSKLEYFQDKGHGFTIIVNGSPVRMGLEPKRIDAEANRAEFIKILKESLNEQI